MAIATLRARIFARGHCRACDLFLLHVCWTWRRRAGDPGKPGPDGQQGSRGPAGPPGVRGAVGSPVRFEYRCIARQPLPTPVPDCMIDSQGVPGKKKECCKACTCDEGTPPTTPSVTIPPIPTARSAPPPSRPPTNKPTVDKYGKIYGAAPAGPPEPLDDIFN